MNRKVFVVSFLRHWDITLAECYGTLVPLSYHSMRKFNTQKMYNTFLPILTESSPEDFILLSGLSVMNGLAMSIFVLKHKRLNLLIHSRMLNRYEVREIHFSEEGTNFNEGI
jgi:hypothetical protein